MCGPPVDLNRSLDTITGERLELRWDSARSFVIAQAPGIPRVSFDHLVLAGTAIDDVEYQPKTLRFVATTTNAEAAIFQVPCADKPATMATRPDEHTVHVRGISSRVAI